MARANVRRAKAFRSHGQGFKNIAFFRVDFKVACINFNICRAKRDDKKACLSVASVLAQVSVFCDARSRELRILFCARINCFARGHVELFAIGAKKKKHVLQITIRHFIFYSLINGCVDQRTGILRRVWVEKKKKIIMSLLRAECRAI